ncbi:hypothetical protein [Salipiger mucosus]|uniref:hypothetical protein n=1 Tax=Salipiger mucosus TaxID=263378 RepID=UPI0012EC9E25|nr:hypothetical protein [Salipiger mucosus]
MRTTFRNTTFKLALSASALALAVGMVGLAGGGDVFVAPAQAAGENAGGNVNAGGSGGPQGDIDGRGPQADAGGGGSTGGQPVWSDEGIPEVELGRLSVARSPDRVIEMAYDEALVTLSSDMLDFYNQSLSEILDDLANEWDTISLIDSPLQNLALMQDALDGSSVLAENYGVTTDNDTLLAVFLGVASDKELPISADTVIAVTTILGTPVTGEDAEALAEAAEDVREAVVLGHG